MLFSGTMLLSLATADGEWAALHFTPRSLIAMVYLTVAGSVVAYTAYVYAVRHLPLSTVALYAYINPMIAVVLGSMLLGEPMTVRILIAGALVLAGTAVVRRVQIDECHACHGSPISALIPPAGGSSSAPAKRFAPAGAARSSSS